MVLTQSLKSESYSLRLLLESSWTLTCCSSDLLGAETVSYPFNYKTVRSTTLNWFHITLL